VNPPTVRAVTRNGRTHYVEEPAKLPPLTPDEMILRAVGAATAVVVLGALIWSTVSVGGMLDQVAPAWAAYMIAAIFDLTWIVAMATEYILRFEPLRQRVPKAIGWIALLISMGAIFTHGALLNAPWIGAFGALVSALAKGLWWLLMFATSRRLDADTQAWLSLELGEVHAKRAEQLAVAKVERERERYALNQPATIPQITVDRIPDQPQSTPVQAADQPVDRIEPAAEPAPVHAVQAAPDRTADRPAHPDEQVTELLTRLRRGEQLTKQDAADILGVPPSTAYRRLNAAKDQLRQYN
jgi:DNA-directed RNA polymerase specialized sigma24 family protein